MTPQFPSHWQSFFAQPAAPASAAWQPLVAPGVARSRLQTPGVRTLAPVGRSRRALELTWLTW